MLKIDLMSTSVITKRLTKIWSGVKPWVFAVIVLLVLRYTGALSGISSLSNRAILETGILNADPDSYSAKKEVFEYGFTVRKPDGALVDFNEYRGKTVFLNIWATWCGPCRAEMPSIQKLYESAGSDSIQFVMLSIDREEDVDKVKQYVASKGFTFPVFIAGELPEQLQVKIIPSTFVISPDGAIVYKKSGLADYGTNKFRKFMDKVNRAQEQ